MSNLQKLFPHVRFIHVDPTDNWVEDVKKPIIIDTVEGLDKPYLFISLSSFEMNNFRITPHDYDLYLDLALMIKLKKIQGFSVIGVPQKPLSTKIVSEIQDILTEVLRSTA